MICRSKQSKYNTNTRRDRLVFLCVFFVILILQNFKVYSDNTDTIAKNVAQNSEKLGITTEFLVSSPLYIGTGLLVESSIFKNKDVNFRQMRQETIPYFNYDYDTYLQFVPLGMTFALKSFNIKSHSSWGQLVAGTLLSYLLGYGTAKIFKENYEELRPDWGGLKSFPSGHTTIAFINASILSKEYKNSDYPWLSIVGYTMATVTGLSRVANNRHWMHDVLAGAGIGMLATEMAYGLTDCIFSNVQDRKFETLTIERPDFFDIYLAYNIPLGKYPEITNNNLKYTIHSGSSLGVEGAYFIHPNIGITARAKIDDYRLNDESFSWPADSVFNIYGCDLGVIFSYPVFGKMFLGLRTALGLSHVRNQEIQYFNVLPKQIHLQYNCGISASIPIDRYTFIRLYADSFLSKLKINNHSQRFSYLSLGATVGLHF
ncbi:MAG: phosphatase PAP2 family protein [Bacteroidales bacterium]|nr:phosphatase PAP2 family protein [Bacteroidales bacterium]